MDENQSNDSEVWLAAGVRTPFVKIDGALSKYDAIGLSVPVVRAMIDQLGGANPDFAVWGSVVPNLTWSNLAREVLMEAGVSPSITAFSTIMACSTSMVGTFEAAGMINGTSRKLALVGGVESMSRVQVGLGVTLSDWLRKLTTARTMGDKVIQIGKLKLADVKLYIPAVTNRTSGMSMGEHTEITAKEWQIPRDAQDQCALESHQHAVAGWERGFFDDLVIPVGDVRRDGIPRKETSLEKLAKLPPAFDRKNGKGTLSAGNSSPLTDGAAAVWVGSPEGLERLPSTIPRVRLVDWEITSIDFRVEGLLMAPAFAIPRLLARRGLSYRDIDIWEIHEAFSAQVLFHIKALEDEKFLGEKVDIARSFGNFPRDRINPNGGSVALGHPFGATGARILSQAIKELAARPTGSRAIVSICADGGQGSVALLEAG